MTEPRLIGGRYELGELLGYGGMAEVHQATDVRLGRLVAVKILRSDLSRDPLFQSRFRREAKAAGSLNHPSIVAVYDTGEERSGDDELPYIVMEFVDGRTLREILTTERRIEPSRAMEIASEVCAALDFSHRAGIVHRDIKPANVMITRTGAVKVMDFGIARAVADSAVTMTQTAAVIGTAQYLSPEQARGETVDARSDVYSAGCLLYELVTGNPPFQGDSPVAVAYQHVRETAAVPSSLNPAVPRSLDSIVMKALAKNPINRYQTAGEMRADLQRALASTPVNAEPVLSDDERTQFIAATPAPRRLPEPGPIELHDEEPDVGRRAAFVWTAVVAVLLLVLGGIAWVVLHPKRKTAAVPAPVTITSVPVPSVVGLKPAAAGAALTRAELKLGASSPVTTCPTKVAVGTVCAQVPSAETTAQQNSPVKISVLVAPATVTVPSVTNLTRDEARKTMQAIGLQVDPIEVHSDQTRGTVIDQTPEYGKQVLPDSLVMLKIADGKHRIPTDLVGKSLEAATVELNGDAGLLSTATKTVVVAQKKQEGKVQGVSPAAGAWVAEATKITLSIGHYLPACPPTSAPASPSATPATPATLPAPTPDGRESIGPGPGTAGNSAVTGSAGSGSATGTTVTGTAATGTAANGSTISGPTTAPVTTSSAPTGPPTCR